MIYASLCDTQLDVNMLKCHVIAPSFPQPEFEMCKADKDKAAAPMLLQCARHAPGSGAGATSTSLSAPCRQARLVPSETVTRRQTAAHTSPIMAATTIVGSTGLPVLLCRGAQNDTSVTSKTNTQIAHTTFKHLAMPRRQVSFRILVEECHITTMLSTVVLALAITSTRAALSVDLDSAGAHTACF